MRYKSIVHGLKEIYNQKVRPIEEKYRFERFHSAPLTDAELEAKPMVLVIGPYSTGKTSLIRELMQCDYPGLYIGPEPTTDKFVAIMHGPENKVVPGHVATTLSDRPFQTLSALGSGFLSKFQLSLTPCPLLEDIMFIDTPGVLAGEKQKQSRDYDYIEACGWFAERASLIIVLTDAHKLDISDEFKAVLNGISAHSEKIKIVLNKAAAITNEQRVRVYGALMWSMGRVLTTSEVPRVFIGNFGAIEPNTYSNDYELINKEKQEIINTLSELPQYTNIRKVNDITKRARNLMIYGLIFEKLRKEMPRWFGTASKQRELINNMNLVFTRIQSETGIPPGDLPNLTEFKGAIRGIPFNTLPSLNKKLQEKLSDAINVDLPRLLKEFPLEQQAIRSLKSTNPFSILPMSKLLELQEGTNTDINDETIIKNKKLWQLSTADVERYSNLYYELNSNTEKHLTGDLVKMAVKDTKVELGHLEKIWNLIDKERVGLLDQRQFFIFMKIVEVTMSGINVPSMLPPSILDF